MVNSTVLMDYLFQTFRKSQWIGSYEGMNSLVWWLKWNLLKLKKLRGLFRPEFLGAIFSSKEPTQKKLH